MENIADRLQPKHLVNLIPDDTEELKKQIEADSPAGDPAKIPAPENPEKLAKSQKEYTFTLNWTDGRGKTWAGKFTSRILSIRDRARVGLMRARLNGGLPVESIDAYTAEINFMVANLAFCLAEKPEWANDLMSLDNVELLQALYKEVASHEATFFGRTEIVDAG
jgi:hypothetical protein